MNPANDYSYEQFVTRIPADVDRPDRLLLGLTGRQLGVLAPVALALYLAFAGLHRWIPLPVLLAVVGLLGMLALAMVMVERDGTSLDRLAVAALTQHRSPQLRVPAPEGLHRAPDWVAAMAARQEPEPAVMELAVRDLDPTGLLDLGGDGVAGLARVGSVNFGLRSAGEQQQLVAAFARWLNTIDGPTQILVRSQRLDLSPTLTTLRRHTQALAHPALRQAAAEHAQFLADLAATRDPRTRQILLVCRQPTPGESAGREQARVRVARQLAAATRGLAAAELPVTVLDGEQATGVLAAAFNPHLDNPPAPAAPPNTVITSPATSWSDTADTGAWAETQWDTEQTNTDWGGEP